MQGIVDDRIVVRVRILLMENNRLHAGLDDLIEVVFFENRFALDDHFVPLDGHHFTGILVDEVFHPGL